MTISNYCYKKGFTLKQYENYASNIESTAQAILKNIKQNYKIDNGLYYNSSEILGLMHTWNDNTNFIIKELKQLGVEFYDNNKLWRY